MNVRPQVLSSWDGIVSRDALAGYLHEAWPETALQLWHQRLNYWWDQNPYCDPASLQGYLALLEQQIVGFGGYIPARFAWQGEPIPGLYATSFRVDEAYSKVAASMFLNQRQVMKENIIVHSTPLPKIQTALLKIGGRAETEMTSHYLALGTVGLLNGRSPWPNLDPTLKVVTQLTEVQSLERPYQRKDRLEKWTTVESLKWYCESPARKHHFIGVVDSQGMLTSYLLLTPRRRKGIKTWDVVETFTTREEGTELLALIGSLVHEPELLPGGMRLLTIADFDHDPALARMPALLRRQEKVCHFFLMPEALREVPKHTVLAEGDLGL